MLWTVYDPFSSMPTSALFIRTRSVSTVDTVPPSDASTVDGSKETNEASTASRAIERVMFPLILLSAYAIPARHKSVMADVWYRWGSAHPASEGNCVKDAARQRTRRRP